MIRHAKAAAVASLLLLPLGSAHATLLTYSLTNTSPDHYTLDYNIENNNVAAGIEEFTVFYDYATITNLSATTSLSDWSPLLAIQPDPSLPADGFVDALTFGAPIALNQRIDHFMTVTLTCTACNLITGQYFNVVDPNTWEAIESGTPTQQTVTGGGSSAVPEPPSLALLLLGLIPLGWRRTQK